MLGKRIIDLPFGIPVTGADYFEASQLIGGIQTSVKIPFSDMIPTLGNNEVAFGDSSTGALTSDPTFQHDPFYGNVGIGDAPPTNTALYVIADTGFGKKLISLNSNDAGFEMLNVTQGAINSRTNNWNMFPSGPLGTGGDTNLNVNSELGGNPTVAFFTTQENLLIRGSSIPVITTSRPELNINAAMVGFNLVGYVANAGVHIHGFGNSTNNALLVENSNYESIIRCLEDRYVVHPANNTPIADARLSISEYTTYIDESTNEFIIKAKYSDGVTVKTASIALV